MTIVVATLQAEYVRMRNKLEGAAKRLTYAHSQAVIEEAAVAEHKADLDMLADALMSVGGMIPGADEPVSDALEDVNGRLA